MADPITDPATPAPAPATETKPAPVPAPEQTGVILSLEFLWDKWRKSNARLDEMDKKVADFESRIKSLEDSMKEVKDKYAAKDTEVNTRLKALEANNWGEKYADLAKKIDDLEAVKEYKAMKAEYADLAQRMTDLEKSVRALKAEEAKEV